MLPEPAVETENEIEIVEEQKYIVCVNNNICVGMKVLVKAEPFVEYCCPIVDGFEFNEVKICDIVIGKETGAL